MGNLEAGGQYTSTDLLSSYRQVRKENSGVILADKKTEDTYFLREISFVDKKQYESELKKYKELQKNQQNQNLISLVRLSSQEFSNFCSSSYKLYAIYEYPSITLQDEIIARKSESKYFEEDELWSILQSCANALGDVKSTISLHPTNIFILPDGILKVVNNDMITEDYRCIIKKGVYYAPEKIRLFNKPDNENSLKKEAIFSLGMTLLHASLLSPVDDCYNYSRYEFNDEKLEEYVESLLRNQNRESKEGNKTQYSEDFIETLAMIIEPNPSKRASLMELHGLLNKAWKTQTDDNNRECSYADPIDEAEQQIEETEQQEREEKAFQKIKPLELSKQPLSIISGSMKAADPSYPSFHPEVQSSFGLKKDRESQYFTPSVNKQNLYTDPLLLEMIKKDLNDLHEMKKSAILRSYANQVMHSTNSYYPFSQFSNATLSFSKNDRQGCSIAMQHIEKQQGPNQQSSIQSSEKKEIENVISEEYEDGRKFQGKIVNGLKQGYGKFMYSDGAYYEGQFVNDKMEGRGTLFYGPGRPAYDGEWFADQFHGYGVLYNESPIDFDGTFNYNDFNLIEDYWVRYEGHFKFDNKSGEGKLILSNGEEFEGSFQNDFINGRGVFATNDGYQVTGLWEDNILVQLDT